jgi:hypothetical protein
MRRTESEAVRELRRYKSNNWKVAFIVLILLLGIAAVIFLANSNNNTKNTTDQPAPVVTEAAQQPTEEPKQEATQAPTEEPKVEATQAPTEEPKVEATEAPTAEPITYPYYFTDNAGTKYVIVAAGAPASIVPTEAPATEQPTEEPTVAPTAEPTAEPTKEPITYPYYFTDNAGTQYVIVAEGAPASIVPTEAPATVEPTIVPTTVPTVEPTVEPTATPEQVYVVVIPKTEPPTVETASTPIPVVVTVVPTEEPATVAPTEIPTPVVTEVPTTVPTTVPTEVPTQQPAVDEAQKIEALKTELGKTSIAGEVLPTYDYGKTYDLYGYADVQIVNGTALFTLLRPYFEDVIGHSFAFDFTVVGSTPEDTLYLVLESGKASNGMLKLRHIPENTEAMKTVLANVTNLEVAGQILRNWLYDVTIANPENANERLFVCTQE